ncbi:hypothetical protein ACHAW6_000555 [Cyclotella cf. meneghiniana]
MDAACNASGETYQETLVLLLALLLPTKSYDCPWLWADEIYLLSKEEGAMPISAYLDIELIINIAKKNGVDAIHPGYGFLSKSPQFARACCDAGIEFVGPTVESLLTFSDKTLARRAAITAGVLVVPGSEALKTKEQVEAFVDECGLPVIIKAAMGGGGEGMRAVVAILGECQFSSPGKFWGWEHFY